ncbi:hypothetical protein CBR_g21989 [Chara braunii]|uniref:Uncharacterized protein n=1 Tax=Chara braunii TaxID=69332 RepID=A0A388L1S0_CHABU|nr:hypothetical protein CBR_g21989 [Chara braunii]|eukprot:GBG76241.1 hypothetical protein CBR_g21989 [Chara braunii]
MAGVEEVVREIVGGKTVVIQESKLERRCHPRGRMDFSPDTADLHSRVHYVLVEGTVAMKIDGGVGYDKEGNLVDVILNVKKLSEVVPDDWRLRERDVVCDIVRYLVSAIADEHMAALHDNAFYVAHVQPPLRGRQYLRGAVQSWCPDDDLKAARRRCSRLSPEVGRWSAMHPHMVIDVRDEPRLRRPTLGGTVQAVPTVPQGLLDSLLDTRTPSTTKVSTVCLIVVVVRVKVIQVDIDSHVDHHIVQDADGHELLHDRLHVADLPPQEISPHTLQKCERAFDATPRRRVAIIKIHLLGRALVSSNQCHLPRQEWVPCVPENVAADRCAVMKKGCATMEYPTPILRIPVKVRYANGT